MTARRARAEISKITQRHHSLVRATRADIEAWPLEMPGPSSPVVLVTGAGVRLGAAAARLLGRRGCRLALHYNGSEAAIGEVAEYLDGIGGCEYDVFQADLSNHSGHLPLVEGVVDRFGGIDVLLNNAGIYESVNFEDVTERDFDEMVAINLKAPFFLAQAAAGTLRERGGLIINVTDTDVGNPYARHSHYFASKVRATMTFLHPSTMALRPND